MLERRLKALEAFESMPMPEWGADLGELEINDLVHYFNPVKKKSKTWADVPDDIRKTFEKTRRSTK